MIHDFNEGNDFDVDMRFGAFLRKKRRLMGLNQTDMGKMLGKDQGTISMWEMGITSPPFDEGTDIIEKLGGKVMLANIYTKTQEGTLGWNPYQE